VEIVYRKGKDNVAADWLSRPPIEATMAAPVDDIEAGYTSQDDPPGASREADPQAIREEGEGQHPQQGPSAQQVKVRLA
jgi:hypothetical protein